MFPSRIIEILTINNDYPTYRYPEGVLFCSFIVVLSSKCSLLYLSPYASFISFSKIRLKQPPHVLYIPKIRIEPLLLFLFCERQPHHSHSPIKLHNSRNPFLTVIEPFVKARQAMDHPPLVQPFYEAATLV